MPVTRPPRILVTRSAHQSSGLADALRALGAEPILIPAIELAEPTSFAALDTALTHLDHFHWLLFTSANAVEAFHHRLAHHPNPIIPSAAHHPNSAIPSVEHLPNSVILSAARSNDRAQPKDLPHSPHPERPSTPSGTDPPHPDPATERRPKIAAIGPSTARALQSIGLIPDLIPPQAVAESLTEALLAHARQPDGSPTRFLLIRAEDAREHLPETLRAAGADLTIAPVYRTIVPEGSLPAIRQLFGSRNESEVNETARDSEPASSYANPLDPAPEPASRYPEPLGSGLLGTAREGGFSPWGMPSQEQPQLPIDAITFTSSSSVRNLLALCEAANISLPPESLRISIGPITSQTLRELGYPPHAESPQATVTALAEAVITALNA